jgi:hypothetical protein
MNDNQFEFKPYTRPKQNANVFLIIAGVVFALTIFYFSFNKKEENKEVPTNNINIINEQPAIDEIQKKKTTYNYAANEEIIINEKSSASKIDQDYYQENENANFSEYELGNYLVNGDENGRAYFHNNPEQSTQRKAYLVKGEVAEVQKIENGFGYVEFTNSNGKTSYGWIKLNLLTFINN